MLATDPANAADVAVATPPPPVPDDGDVLHLFVGDAETYDSNLYRLASSVNPATAIAPNATRSDTFNTATLGGQGQWLLGRQVFDLTLHVDENRFARNDLLNNTDGDGKVLWNWVVGSPLSGQLGVEYNRALAAFSQTLYLGRDLVDTKDYFGNLRYHLGPHWSLYGAARNSEYTHSASAVQYNNLRYNTGDGGIEYDTGVGRTFGLEYDYSTGSYPQNYVLNGAVLDRNYREQSPRVVVDYAFTEKTSLAGYAGYYTRDYRDPAIGRFTGVIWRFKLDWRPTDKTDLVAETWHELHAYSVSQADYFVSRGVSISPVWNYSEKLTLSAAASFEQQNYIASSTSVLLVGGRTDKLTGEQINALYTLRQNLYINAFFRNEQRTSPVKGFRYNDQLATVSVTFRFW